MIVLNDKSSDPLYMQIYEQIKEKILAGHIPEGTRLQSIRGLSESLGVSKNTVKYAYGQLCSEGYISNRARSGFFSQNIGDASLFNLQGPNDLKKFPRKKETNREKRGHTYKYNFQYGMLNPLDFPINVWRKISNQLLSPENVQKMVSYPERKGEPGLRAEIMKYLYTSRGVSCRPEQIVICPGTQFALNLLSQLLKRRSAHIAVEDPGYDGARCVFINNGLNVLPIGLDDGGIQLDELENSAAKIIYTTPSHQFPTGTVMPIRKRLKLLEWAVNNAGIIIEDDYDSELRYGGKPIPSIQSIDHGGSVVYLGTLSKSLSPALRLSYIVFPESLRKEYDDVFKRYNSSVPWLEQKTLELFMHSGHWERHLRKICLANKKRHDILIHTINKRMKKKVVIHGKNAGLHVLLEFNNGLSEEVALKRALDHGVKVYPVSQFWLQPEQYKDNMILLGFSGMTEDDIVEGLQILNKAWFDDYKPL